jgi:hypothetical protein
MPRFALLSIAALVPLTTIAAQCPDYSSGTASAGIGSVTGGTYCPMIYVDCLPSIGTIEVQFGRVGGTSAINGDPLTLAVWDDPSDDQNPNDAVLVATIPIVAGVTGGHTGQWQVYDIAALTGLPIPCTGGMFIGAAVSYAASSGHNPSSIDFTTFDIGRMWMGGRTPSPAAEAATHCLLVAGDLATNEAERLAAAAADERLQRRFRMGAELADSDPRRLIGKPFELAGRLATGEQFSTAALRGKVVLVFFQASWCAPCERELPTITALAERYRDRGLAIVGVSCDDDQRQLERFASAHPEMTWPQFFDASQPGWHPSIAAASCARCGRAANSSSWCSGCSTNDARRRYCTRMARPPENASASGLLPGAKAAPWANTVSRSNAGLAGIGTGWASCPALSNSADDSASGPVHSVQPGAPSGPSSSGSSGTPLQVKRLTPSQLKPIVPGVPPVTCTAKPS